MGQSETGDNVANAKRQRAPVLPANYAFVVQLRRDVDVARGTIAGRVEHVVSARAAHFGNVVELLAFITRVLSEEGPRPTTTKTKSAGGGRGRAGARRGEGS